MLKPTSKLKSSTVMLTTALSLLGSLAGLTGCQLVQPTPEPTNSYPTTPPGTKTVSSVVANPGTSSGTEGSGGAGTEMGKASAIKVPADAVELSHGDYPPPGFPAPSMPGLLMVVDMDGDPTTAVASTAVTGKDAGKMMSITDVANMSITMNKLHRYRIVFVPSKPPTP